MKKIVSLIFATLVLSFMGSSFAQFIINPCIPGDLPPIFKPSDIDDIFKKGGQGYEETIDKTIQQSRNPEQASQVAKGVEQTVTRILLLKGEQQRRHVNSMTSCLVDNKQMTAQEQRALNMVMGSIITGDAKGAQRATQQLKANISSELIKGLYPAVESAVRDYSNETNEPTTQSSTAGSVGKALGAIGGGLLGAAFGPEAIAPGAVIGSAVGEAAGELANDYFGGGEEGGEEGDNGGDTGDTGQ